MTLCTPVARRPSAKGSVGSSWALSCPRTHVCACQHACPCSRQLAASFWACWHTLWHAHTIHSPATSIRYVGRAAGKHACKQHVSPFRLKAESITEQAVG